jgi:D-glycero-alpha-D-manno-heptose-7-phosphate kinase
MIITKTPFRVSFFGGGTDYPDYFLRYGGGVLSTSINKYSFILVKPLDKIETHRYKITYSKLELCEELEQIQHPAVRECIKFLKLEMPLEVHVFNDLPARTGIGSSSTFTVGLLHALYALKGQVVSKERLAEEAVYVEQKLLNERVGVQDQYAAAIGGLNTMTFGTDGRITVNPIAVSLERRKELSNHLLIFYTGIARYAHQVLEEQIQKTKENKNTQDLSAMQKMVQRGVDILAGGDLNDFGHLLHDAWQAKRRLSSAISTSHIDAMYDTAQKAGALGGKLLGAGGGGFMLFFAEPKQHQAIRTALAEYPEVHFDFESDGTRIVYLT